LGKLPVWDFTTCGYAQIWPFIHRFDVELQRGVEKKFTKEKILRKYMQNAKNRTTTALR